MFGLGLGHKTDFAGLAIHGLGLEPTGLANITD